LQPYGAGSQFHVSQRSFGIGSIGRIDEHGNKAAPGTNSRRSSSRFATNSPLRILIPVALPPPLFRSPDASAHA
jgi:hypothetical protein